MTTAASDVLVFDRDRDVPRLAKLAEQNIWIGTSSWKYEGWVGKVYKEDYSGPRSPFVQRRFDEEALHEVSRVFPTVCFDGGYYRFPEHRTFEKYAASLPERSQFALKVTDQITIRRVTQGPQRGELNPGFLDAALFTQHFLPPVTETLGSKLGPIIFEFSPFHFGKSFAQDQYKSGEFVRQLDKFFCAIPLDAHKYAVEVRDAVLLTPERRDYFDVLEHYGIAHTFNEQTWMPELEEQLDVPGIYSTSFSVVRALVRPGVSHENAVKEFQPYKSVQRPMPQLRLALATLIKESVTNKRGLYIYVNNRTEGNAPDTIANVLDLYEQEI